MLIDLVYLTGSVAETLNSGPNGCLQSFKYLCVWLYVGDSTAYMSSCSVCTALSLHAHDTSLDLSQWTFKHLWIFSSSILKRRKNREPNLIFDWIIYYRKHICISRFVMSRGLQVVSICIIPSSPHGFVHNLFNSS